MTQHLLASVLLAASFAACLLQPCRAEEGAKVTSFYGYDDCIRLANSQTTVTLCPAAGEAECWSIQSVAPTSCIYLRVMRVGFTSRTNAGAP